MKVIGVTGGVGAGKSTVLNYLRERYRARLLVADEIGHEVMEPGAEAYDGIVGEFGRGILAADGRIDRAKLGNIVFADPEKLSRLNALIHPAVRARILRGLSEAEADGAKYAVVEAALFLEENYDAFCDETWYIYTNEGLRRQRLKESRGYSDERVDQIFARQKRYEEFLERCQTVIDNNGTAEETCRQIDRRMKQ